VLLLFVVLRNVERFNYVYSQVELNIDRGKEKEENLTDEEANNQWY
jgi:hypothetical protein